MGLTLTKALRLSADPCIAFVGAGGKTSTIFNLAREFSTPIIVTATTHLGKWQIKLADQHLIATSSGDLKDVRFDGITLITGPFDNSDRTTGLDTDVLVRLRAIAAEQHIPLLIEADGARQNSLKAPVAYEPPIPKFVETVVVLAGMSALGKPLSEKTVYHPELYAKLSDLKIGQPITSDSIVKLLCHLEGGQKNIPVEARKIALLNQCDTPQFQSTAYSMLRFLLPYFGSIIISSMKQKSIFAAHESGAGIILAAGGSIRYGQPKQLLDWHGEPFVRTVTKTALEAGLSPVVVVTGANAEDVELALNDLPVTIERNANWQTGQSSSIKVGINGITKASRMGVGSAIFLLVDQPQITASVIGALMNAHASGLQPIVAPLILKEKRGNPVLFDRDTFADLMNLKGDVGGRGIFSKFHIEYIPWHDERLLFDVDEPDDYKRLIEGYS